MTGKIQPKLVQELEPEETEPKPATDALEHKETTAAADNAAELHATEEQLDEEEREFRAMRRDLPGVKGASAAGIVAISVGKAPTKNEFFRTHPTFRPIVPIVDHEVGMESTYFAVTADMVEPLAAIGITVTDHVLYLTVTSRGTTGSCRFARPTPTASRTNITAPKRSGWSRASTNGCGCSPTWKTAATRSFRRRPGGSAIRNGPT